MNKLSLEALHVQKKICSPNLMGIYSSLEGIFHTFTSRLFFFHQKTTKASMWKAKKVFDVLNHFAS